MTRNYSPCLFLLLLLLFSAKSEAQLLINELSSSCNKKILADDNGDAQDWVELYNASATTINLSSLFLSDKSGNPALYALPNVSLPPSQFIIFYCSGENRVNGSFYHTNFKIDRNGETIYLTDGSNVLDSINTGDLELNHSSGRTTDGSVSFSVFTTPSPGASNNTSTPYYFYLDKPQSNLAAGFYSTAQAISLNGNGDTVRYTTDGSSPTNSSPIFPATLNLSSTTLIKARCYGGSDTLPSKVLTLTYFINETGLGDLSVISMGQAPGDFDSVYNYSNYVLDFFPEKIASIEYFDESKQFKWQTEIDLKLHGTTSTSLWPQKGFRVNCRPYYNNTKINQAFFPNDKPQLTESKGFNLRHDYGGGGMWDYYATEVSRSLNIDYLAFHPTHVFVNGNYWGIYHLREKGDEEYLEYNHPGTNEDSLDLLRQNYNFGTGYNGIIALAGSDTGFFNAIATQQLLVPQTPAFRNSFESNFDRKNFFDYMIAGNYVGNTDWMGSNSGIINNVKLWRNWTNGKWRYILYDCDYSLGMQTPTTDVLTDILNPNALCYHGQLFSRLMLDTLYKYYFINRFADMMNTIYLPVNANLVVTAYHDTLATAISKHFAKWGNSTFAQWENNLNTYFIANAQPRIDNLRNQLQSHFSLVQQLDITFEVYPPNAGTLLLNTIHPDNFPWTGVYFNGAPVDMKALPNTGYTFSHWDSPQIGIINTDSLHINLTGTQTIRLYFTPITTVHENANPLHILLYPNPAKEFLNVQSACDGQINFYNLEGIQVGHYRIKQGTTTIHLNGFITGLYNWKFISETQIISRGKIAKY